MADKVAEAGLTADWLELTGALGLRAGKRYLLDVHTGTDRLAQCGYAETDGAEAPTVAGQRIGIARAGYTDSREYAARQGVRLWMRVTRGTATVAASEVA